MMNFVGKVSGWVGKYLTLLVLLTIVSAYFVPGMYLWAVKYTVWMLGVVMFGMGMTLHTEDFKRVLQRPREVLIGTVCQYTIMPLAAYLLVRVFNLSADLAVGMVLLGSCPGGTASNVMTFLAKGCTAFCFTDNGIDPHGPCDAAIPCMGTGRAVGYGIFLCHGHDGC